jgi:hypothetical protein
MHEKLEERVNHLKGRGYKVGGPVELNESWQNLGTKEVKRVIGAYSLADSVNDYGDIYLTEDGDAWRSGDLHKHWRRHASK